jgi:hypothetical protein
MCTRCGHLSKHDAGVNIGFGSGLSTVASDRAPEREACSPRARFVGTIIFKKIVRRRNFMKNTILITGLAAAFGLSINAAAKSSAAQQGAPTVKTGSALKAKAALAMTYADWGKPAEAKALYAELVARAAREYIQPSQLAIAAAAAGERENAVDYVREAYEIRDPMLIIANY